MSQYRTARSLMLEQDTEKIRESMEPLTTLKDVDWRHQQAAMVAGYNSVLEMAVDEILTRLGEMSERMDRIEQTTKTLRGEIWAEGS
jgi:malonyl CoA-acyl carrier protein transacylase